MSISSRFCVPVLLALACLLLPSAQGGTVDAVATFNNVGIVYDFDVAPGPGTEVSVSIREADSTADYQPAHPLSPIGETRFAGSVFSLKPGTEYSFRLSSAAFEDDHILSVTTRSDSFADATGTVYHVRPDGDDNADGLTLGTAFATVGKGISIAQAGDEVRLHDGRYYEGDLNAPRSGTALEPIVIRAAPGARPVLDGTDPTFAQDFSPVGNDVYRTPTAVQPQHAYVNGEHLFRYRTLEDLQNNKWNILGYYADGEHMYVRLPNNEPPDAHAVTVPRHTNGLTIRNQDHVHVKDIGFESYGLGWYPKGVYIDGGDENLIDGCSFKNTGVGVGIRRAAHFNTIQNNTFDETSVGSWSFEAVKQDADDYETGAIFVYASDQANVGNVIRGNLIQNMFDGVHLYSYNAESPTQNLDFHDNVLVNLVDDAIETDGAGSNNRIYANRLSGFLTGISIAPAHEGPTYIMRNVLIGWRNSESGTYEGYPFKLNVSSDLSTNWVYLYHNTAWSDEENVSGFLFKGYSDWHDVISRNNIFAGTGYALWSWPTGEHADHPVDFDYDNLFTTDDERFIRWAGEDYDNLADFFAATGHEEHGVSLPPGFIDPADGNFYLRPDSGMIDRGIWIPGINDGFFGEAPDLGAFEHRPPEAHIPIPEPGALLGLGACLLCIRRRR